MKTNLLLLFLFVCSHLLAQTEEFNLRGKIVDFENRPIADAYVINYRDLKKIISDQNGQFNIWVQPHDSLMISHISFQRKKVFVNPHQKQVIIQLELDTINVIRVDVSPDQNTDEMRARNNILFLKELDIPAFTKIKTETQPVEQMVLEHNKIMHSEATSVTFIRFSPSEYIAKIVKKVKRRKKSKQYNSSKKK